MKPKIKEKIKQIIPICRQMDAVLKDDCEIEGISRYPVIYMALIERTYYYDDTKKIDIEEEAIFCDSEPCSDVNYEGGWTKWEDFLGFEYDGIKKNWSLEIEKRNNKK